MARITDLDAELDAAETAPAEPLSFAQTEDEQEN